MSESRDGKASSEATTVTDIGSLGNLRCIGRKYPRSFL